MVHFQKKQSYFSAEWSIFTAEWSVPKKKKSIYLKKTRLALFTHGHLRGLCPIDKMLELRADIMDAQA